MQNYQNHPLAGARDLDTAMTTLWSFYKSNFIGLYVISLIMTLLTAIISSTLDLSALQSTTDPAEMIGMMKDMMAPYSLLLLVSLVMGVFLHAYVLKKPDNSEFSFMNMLRDSAIALLPYLLTMILLGICGAFLISIGLVLLILPGLFAIFYFITVVIFALPVTLVESGNPLTVIPRSFSLAHRNFWSNIGWVTVVTMIVVILSFIIGGLTMLPFTGSFIKSLTNPEEAAVFLELAKNPVYIGLSSVTSAFITPVFPILAFILYFRNKEDKSSATMIPEEEGRVKVEDLYPKMPDRE